MAAAAAACTSSSWSSSCWGPYIRPRPLPYLCPFRLSSSSFVQSLQLLPYCPPSSPPSPLLAARSMSGSSSSPKIDDLVKDKLAQNPVVVFSKTWCPYCSRVKGLFNEVGVKALVVELDELVDEAEVQGALQRLTGQSTVPNVFIGGKHIGGCDDTMALHQRGELISLLKAAGAKF